jgi:hypothetical protein
MVGCRVQGQSPWYLSVSLRAFSALVEDARRLDEFRTARGIHITNI